MSNQELIKQPEIISSQYPNFLNFIEAIIASIPSEYFNEAIQAEVTFDNFCKDQESLFIIKIIEQAIALRKLQVPRVENSRQQVNAKRREQYANNKESFRVKNKKAYDERVANPEAREAYNTRQRAYSFVRRLQNLSCNPKIAREYYLNNQDLIDNYLNGRGLKISDVDIFNHLSASQPQDS